MQYAEELILRFGVEGTKNFLYGLGVTQKEMEKIIKTGEKQIKLKLKQNKVEKDSFKEMTNTYRVMLPVIFASQQLHKATSSLLQPSLDMLGVQDIWNTMLGVAFLPTAEKVLDGVLSYGDALNDLPDDIREGVGDQIQLSGLLADTAGGAAEASTALAGIGDAIAGDKGKKIGEIAGLLLGVAAGTHAIASSPATAAVATIAGIGSEEILTGLASTASQTDIIKQNIDEIGKNAKTTERVFNEAKFILTVTRDTKTVDEFIEQWKNMSSKNVTLGVTLTINDINLATQQGVADALAGRPERYQTTNTAAGLLSAFGFGNKMFSPEGTAWLKANFPGAFAQDGGIVGRTGLAYIHKGETITPAGGSNNYSPNISINASIGSNMDIRNLAATLNKYMYEEWRRVGVVGSGMR